MDDVLTRESPQEYAERRSNATCDRHMSNITDGTSTIVGIIQTPTARHKKDAELSACKGKLAVEAAKAAIMKNKDTTTPYTLATVFEEYEEERRNHLQELKRINEDRERQREREKEDWDEVQKERRQQREREREEDRRQREREK